ncbi:hypothetical protein AB0C59_15265 [Streptomyces sp. NPDC048664]|uniref:hypothetical protein n=1 Tax=Streptomyces sp. NPDC048664 TaxID=3154505 RepID=UPI00344AD7B8
MHLTTMLGLYGALLTAGVRLPDPVSGTWWMQIPLRLLAAAALTGVLVAAFRVFEKPSGARESRAPRAWAGPAAALGATLVAVHVTAPASMARMPAGRALVERAGRAARG